MASPKPRPAALKLIEGRGHGRDSGGRLVKTPPPFSRVAPSPPDWLTDDARAEWAYVVPELSRLNLLKEIDRASLAAYCEAVSLFRAATEDIKEQGIVVVNRGRDAMAWRAPNPSVGVQHRASASIRGWAAEFGLTPSAEQRLAIASADGEETPFD